MGNAVSMHSLTNGCTTGSALPAWPHLAGQTCPVGGWLRLRSLDKPTVVLQQKGHVSQLSAAPSFDAHGSWPRLQQPIGCPVVHSVSHAACQTHSTHDFTFDIMT